MADQSPEVESAAEALAGPVKPDLDELLRNAGFAGQAPSEARARAAEVLDHLNAKHFGAYKILATTTTGLGETVDWVDPHDLDPDFDKMKPPSEVAPPSGAIRNLAIADNKAAMPADPGYAGPPNTVAILRPNLSHYISDPGQHKSLKAFLDAIPKPQPSNVTHLYGGRDDVSSTAVNIGSTGWMNYFDIQQVSSDGMSLGQLALGSCNAFSEDIEIGLQKLPSLYGDYNLHIFAYFTRVAYASEGDYVGGYNRRVAGFVPYTGAYPIGATIPGPYSTVNGSQVERRLRIVKSGNAYWLQDYVSDTSYTWLGYYPVGTGTGQIPFTELNTGSCGVSWYGETSDSSPTDWAATDMAGGQFASGTFGKAGYFRNMILERTAGNVWLSTASTQKGPVDTHCYTVSNVNTNGGTNWQVYFYYGGPGGDASGCD
jgi:hypothetical protein